MENEYDVGIVGAGLAGLALSILLSNKGLKVALFEKKKFPFHKLCGEYLSKESLPFLESLGINLSVLNPPEISRLEITNNSGRSIKAILPLGGIGISRYRLDHILFVKAKKCGVDVFENTAVREIKEVNGSSLLETVKGKYYVKLPILSYGKRSNLKKYNSPAKSSKNEYLGVKYHVRLASFPDDLILMNNFKNGYCGVCRVEDDWVSLCYLSGLENLKKAGNMISRLEEEVLFQNNRIAEIFKNAEFVYNKPITVSNIDFYAKKLYTEKFLFCGDAAGLITPLCGNGMSIALHSAKILSRIIVDYIANEISYKELCKRYETEWQNNFGRRMKVGRKIQGLFRNQNLSDFALVCLSNIPVFNKRLIRLTHGAPF